MSFVVTDALLQKGRETPCINTSDLDGYRLAELDYGMTIGVAVTRGGRVFVCWVGGGDSPKAYMVLAYSDGGGMCGDPILAIDPHDDALPCDRCTIVGTVWVDPQNRLWLFFNQTLGHFDGCSSNWAIRCDDPDADTLVWTEPQCIWHGVTLNKPIVRENGEWLLPISLWTRQFITPPFGDCYHELDDLRMAHVFSSRDNGKTFQRRGGVRFPGSIFDEHMLVERADGSLWMLGRTRQGVMESESQDGGATWSEPKVSAIQSVCSRFHLRKLSSGRLLLIKHGEKLGETPGRRSHLTAFLSGDDGKTWSDGFLLDERFEISYPDATEDAQGNLYITYDRDRAVRGEILLAKLREEDIMRQAIVCPGSHLGRVVAAPGKAPISRPQSTGLKARLAAGDSAFGIMLSEIYVPNVARLLAQCSYDYVLVDCEHGYFDLTQVANLCAVADGISLPVLVRVAQSDCGQVTKYLDMGARGILLSNVESAREAGALVNSCLYAPGGDRGVSTFRAHMGYRRQNGCTAMEQANERMLVICQIESQAGLDSIDDILSIEGVDGVLIGPNDLSQRMGVYGQYGHETMEAAMNRVASSARRHGKWSGIITSNMALAGRCADKGMRCFCGGSELSALASGAEKTLKALKESYTRGGCA